MSALASKRSRDLDVIVVGAGMMGSAAAYALARRGSRVLLLEQFAVGHTRGSSHGGSRIVRYAHAEPAYAGLMPALLEQWRALEAASGEPLLDLCGGLYVATPDDPFLAGSLRTLAALGMAHTMLDARAVAERFPQFRLRPDEIAFVEPNAGVVAATRSVQAQVALAVRHGAEVREGWRARRVMALDDGVEVECEAAGVAATLRASRVVLVAGPWAQSLLRDLIGATLPLRVTRQQVGYFRVERPETWSPRRCPVFIFTSAPAVYGFPVFERPGLIKVAQELFDLETEPDALREVAPHAATALGDAVRARLRGVDPRPVQIDPCVYTETPARDFIVDRHPEHPQIVFAAGFSGRGFKFGPGIGELLAHLCMTPANDYAHPMWLPRFALHNFLHLDDTSTVADIFRRL